MSATLSGLIVLENARPVDDAPSSVMFDGQMWLGPGRILTGIFRYYNSSNYSFPEVGHYFAWIHVRYSKISSCIVCFFPSVLFAYRFDRLRNSFLKVSRKVNDDQLQGKARGMKEMSPGAISMVHLRSLSKSLTYFTSLGISFKCVVTTFFLPSCSAYR